MTHLERKFTVLAMFLKGTLAPEAFLCPEVYDTLEAAHVDARNLIQFEGAETVTVYSYPINSKATRNHMRAVSRHSQQNQNFNPVKIEEIV